VEDAPPLTGAWEEIQEKFRPSVPMRVGELDRCRLRQDERPPRACGNRRLWPTRLR
jgi:hypothetical protein